MYLGMKLRTVKAQDAGTIQATRRVPLETVSAVVETVATPVVAEVTSVTDAERVVQLEQELAKARSMDAHSRGRLRKALNVIRGKNRTIARLERELAAHSSSDPLTVDMVLTTGTPAKVS